MAYASGVVPLRRDAAVKSLAAHRAELDELGVRSLVLFGSVARDEATADSDVDLVVEFERPVGFFALFRLRDKLESWLGCAVDLVVHDAVRPELRERIEREGLRAA